MTTLEGAEKLGADAGCGWLSRGKARGLLEKAGLPAGRGHQTALIEAIHEQRKVQADDIRARLHGRALFVVTSEHCNGKDVGHPCSTGVHTDPSEKLDFVVAARNEQEAREFAEAALARIVEEHEDCACGRDDGTMYDEWWNSVSIIVELADITDDVTVLLSVDIAGCSLV